MGTRILTLLLSVALIAGCASRTRLPEGSDAEAFDAIAWNAENAAGYVEGGVSPRQAMLEDLVQKVLPHKTGVELEALLGPPSDSGYFRDSGAALIYATGPEREGFLANIDSEWLLIWLDEAGTYQRYEIWTD